MRKIVIAAVAAVALMMLSIPAFGYEVIWDGAQSDQIKMSLQIDCYIQIQWQDTDILFTDQPPYDWWSTTLQPVGTQRCPDDDNQHPMYAWAGNQAGGRFYESDDGAVIYVHSNNTLSMKVHRNGNLTGQKNSPNNKIPTWFTIALCPFMINGAWLSGHTIPGTSEVGIYASDDNGDFVMETGTGADHPNQFVFPCTPASDTYMLGPMDPEVQGTIKFLARIERHGMADPGDQYYTWLDVWFTTP